MELLVVMCTIEYNTSTYCYREIGLHLHMKKNIYAHLIFHHFLHYKKYKLEQGLAILLVIKKLTDIYICGTIQDSSRQLATK